MTWQVGALMGHSGPTTQPQPTSQFQKSPDEKRAELFRKGAKYGLRKERLESRDLFGGGAKVLEQFASVIPIFPPRRGHTGDECVRPDVQGSRLVGSW